MHRLLSLFGIPAVILLIFSSGYADAASREKRVSNNSPVRQSTTAKFDILVSQSFFECSPFNLKKPFPINPLQDASFALFPHPELLRIEERVADRFFVISRYPGGEMLYDALCVGLEFVSFSKDITTYGNSYFRTGYRFRGTRGGLRTGFFYNF